MVLQLDTLLNRGPVTITGRSLSPAEFWTFCEENPNLQLERTAKGEVSVMAPSDAWSDGGNTEATTDLNNWNRGLPEPGRVFGPSAGFTLPSGAVRSPDGAWISPAKMTALRTRPYAEQYPFPLVVPEFILEVMSSNDRLNKAHDKMEEWIAAGVELGWLVDRRRRKVFVYKPGEQPEEMDDPAEMRGDPTLPGFVLAMPRVF